MKRGREESSAKAARRADAEVLAPYIQALEGQLSLRKKFAVPDDATAEDRAHVGGVVETLEIVIASLRAPKVQS